MINGKSVIAIVPARSGSKGLVGKNIKMLCGKPLVAWSIQAGLSCNYIDELMVTTDDENIKAIALLHGAHVPFIRPSHLAQDASTTFDAVQHTIDFYRSDRQREFDYIILLEPTSPLREPGDIDSMMEKLVALDAMFDAIVSLGPAHTHPSILKKVRGNEITPYCPNLASTNRRQDNDIAYFPYGVAYVIKTKTLFAEKTFYPTRTTFFKIKRHQCFEIDDVYDFLSVKMVMEQVWGLT